MDRTRRDESIGAGWITAMIVLVILLTVGLILYFGMTAPLDQPSSRLPDKGVHGTYCHGPSGIEKRAFERVMLSRAKNPLRRPDILHCAECDTTSLKRV
ncbi:MAG: hypothetical protein N3B12_04405 [Armatimonadetes bacterium]|nr:hypothetical protein [Armatimonadota bacterium]